MTVRILVGDVRDRLRSLDADSKDIAVTTARLGLGDEGYARQIGSIEGEAAAAPDIGDGQRATAKRMEKESLPARSRYLAGSVCLC